MKTRHLQLLMLSTMLAVAARPGLAASLDQPIGAWTAPAPLAAAINRPGQPLSLVVPAAAPATFGISRTLGADAETIDKAWLFKARVRLEGAAAVQVLVRQDFEHLKSPVVFAASPKILGDELDFEVPIYLPRDARRTLVALLVRGAAAGDHVLFNAELAPVPEGAKLPELTAAIDQIRSTALRRDAVNWPEVERLAQYLQRTAGTEQPDPATLGFVLRSLGDGHSFVIAPSAPGTAPMGAVATAKDSAGAARPTPEIQGVALVRPPAIASMDPIVGKRYAIDLVTMIASQAKDSRNCGWIVDLRGNRGGNMYPPLAGLRPLLGDGVFGNFLAVQGASSWGIDRGVAGSGSLKIDVSSIAGPDLSQQPVAVLLDAATASSAEALAMSFIGRPNTRLFGARSAGQTSGNRVLQLGEIKLAVAASMMADRHGRTYPLGISPDVDLGAAIGDPVPDAARAWIGQSCAAPIAQALSPDSNGSLAP